MKPIPDSEIARNAESMLRATSQAALVNHCLRSYMWGAALAEIENITFDAELLFVSAALHDLGLLAQFDSGAPFEHDSASEARQFTSSHGWPEDKTSTAGQVIVLHVAPDVTLDNGAEAYLLWQATAVDVTGSRLACYPRQPSARSFPLIPGWTSSTTSGDCSPTKRVESPTHGPGNTSKPACWSD